MFATQVLSEDLREDTEKEDDDIEIVGFIVMNDCKYEIKKGETKIGRDPTECSVVIENFTVSKVHAFIESDGIDDTFIYDAGSTNQTKLGKKTLKPHCRYKLENDSTIRFGNVTAKYILPFEIREKSETKSNSENIKASNGLDDIFDVVTQVTTPHPHTSGKILQFVKQPENSRIFKVPDFVDSGEKIKGSPESLKKLISQGSVAKTEFHSGSYDASAIFSLNTQCQIIQPSNTESKSEDKTLKDNHSINESDLVKSFLCDGQDGVLCKFMSLHSPGGQTPSELPKEIKTEIVQENCSQLFEAQTQIQAIPVESNPKTNEQGSQLDASQNSLKPITCSSLLDNGSNLNPASISSEILNLSAKVAEEREDFIKTQEYNSNPALTENGPSLVSGSTGDDAPQESDTECYYEKTTDVSTPEDLPENEDLICTQKFEALFNDIQDRGSNSAEKMNESNEDLMETQLYNFEAEQNNKGFEKGTGENTTSVPLIVSESPEKDSEPYMQVDTDFTQRNREEDFIGTQVFSEMTQIRNADGSKSESSERNYDDCDYDEDFIATQPVDLLPTSHAENKYVQEPIYIETASRESSPDLLDSGFSVKTLKDFIKQSPENSSFSEKINSVLLTSVKVELNEDIHLPSVERIESSGEETESDLEIIFDKSENSKKRIEECSEKSFNDDSQQPEISTTAMSSGAHDNDSDSSYVFQLEPEAPEEVGPNPTETKENTVQGRAVESDSDATDCEDVAVIAREMPVEQELLGRISFNESRLSASPRPNSFAEGCVNARESPSFEIGNENECWSQLSLEMPATQDMESALNKIIHNKISAAVEDKESERDEDYQTPSKIIKTEVTTSGSNFSQSKTTRQVDSPLKRPGNSGIEAVPTKKSKIETSDRKLRSSEKQFLKLWQVHDFEQIQPSRTRNSLKNGLAENKSNKTDISLGNNISNKFTTSRRETNDKRKNNRKLGFDITSYLCKKAENGEKRNLEGKKKETPPKENEAQPKPVECCRRVLRSSIRNSVNSCSSDSFEHPARQVLTRSTRNSRSRIEDYFGNSCVNVVFTGFDCESLQETINSLGGKKTNDLTSGDVVVADKVRRTVKFLGAIALSLPIASPQWLVACRAEQKFLNPWNFLLKDENSEMKWGFELKASLERSKNAKLMQGLSVFATANAKPPVKDLMAIVKYCGGSPILERPDKWPKKTVIVSCPEDKRCWPHPKFRNIKIVHYEFILIGVLRQKLDFKTYKLR